MIPSNDSAAGRGSFIIQNETGSNIPTIFGCFLHLFSVDFKSYGRELELTALKSGLPGKELFIFL